MAAYTRRIVRLLDGEVVSDEPNEPSYAAQETTPKGEESSG